LVNRKSYRWEYREEQGGPARKIASALGLNAAVARVLANRGLGDDAAALDAFMHPSLGGLHDPFLMRDMDAATARISHAIHSGEAITVFGDYDVDGITSTALLVRLFKFLGHGAVRYYIPHRLNEGYGMQAAALDSIAATGTRLLITVDNGITALEQVAHARRIGMDVVVTDHHQPDDQLPDASAVVNPNRADCGYPNKALAGVGVAFKLAHAVLKHEGVSSGDAIAFLRSVMDLTAIGTVADVAALVGENRTLVKHGLEQARHTTNVGLRALMDMLDFGPGAVTAEKIGFQMAPRLNAAGRTQHASVCVELLTTNDAARATEIAGKLEEFNRDRRSVESRIFEQSMDLVRDTADLEHDRVLVVSGAQWHIGVIGIVASKLVDAFGRPTIVLSEHDGRAKGSGRSVPGFNIHAALDACRRHIITFGGHPGAAGLQIESKCIDSFRAAINLYARDAMEEMDMNAPLLIDTVVEPDEMEIRLAQDAFALEPFGQSNPAPVFAAENFSMTEQPRVVGTNHLKLALAAPNGRRFSAIGFGLGELAAELSRCARARIDVAFEPTINDYFGGSERLEMRLRDLKIRNGQ
jgi:single-stranded-DNA-specific exonuclease